VTRRSGLGRGLGALIPGEMGESMVASGALREMPIDAIEPNRFQPREHFDEERLDDLANSIREIGVLQPILVRATEDPERFELIAGERRWRAARRAGLTTIPAILREAEDLGALEQALVENLHRQDLNVLEEAAAYQQLMEDFGLTQEQVGERVGRSRAAVANILRLLQLPPTVQRLLAEDRLSAGHARAIAGMKDRVAQERVARRSVDEGLTVRQVEDLVRSLMDGGRAGAPAPSAPDPTAPRRGVVRDPGVVELEELLAAQLDTRVRVELGAGRGRMVIEFADLDDLERIYRSMAMPGA
jgi:ParB family transcriptional regulator, chromosome partitioning protein